MRVEPRSRSGRRGTSGEPSGGSDGGRLVAPVDAVGDDLPADIVLAASAEAPALAPRRRWLRDTTLESLNIRDFRALWFGFMGSWFAMQFQQVARGYLAYELTGSALAIGVVTLAMGLPRIVLSPVGGWLADRYPKRDVVTAGSVFMTVLGVATALLYMAGQLTIGWLVAIGLLQGIAFAFLMPARQAWTPQVVGTGHLLANAVSLNNAGMNLTRVAGPAIAGLLISTPGFGLGGTFLTVAACWLWVSWSARQVHDPGAASGEPRTMTASVRDGFAYVRASPALLALMSLGFVPLAIGMPYINLMPAVADGPFHGGATLLGILLSVGGVGSLFGTLVVASLSRYPKRATMQLVLGVAFGLAVLGFGFFVGRGEVIASIPFLFLAGMTGDAYMALNSSLIMMSTDAGYYGRVMGVYMVAQSIRPISVMPIGAIADVVGVPNVLIGSGAIVALFVALVARLYPDYRKIGSPVLGAVPPRPARERAHAEGEDAAALAGED